MSSNNESPEDAGYTENDGEIEAAIFEKLKEAGHRQLCGIMVRVDSGRVVLSGTVPTYFLKQVAQETARKTCPQHRVYNELRVTNPQ